jgi:hypothetical protein
MITFASFRTAIRGELWPFPGEAKSLRAAHDKYFVEAMISLQRWIPQLQVNHTSVYSACATYVQCGLTVIEAPVGVIKRIYTIASGDWCDKVYLSSRSHKEVLQWQRCLLRRFTPPENARMPALQQGFRFVEASTDSVAGRARAGIWSIDRKRLHIAPWLQSNESLVIEWDGEKNTWEDLDILDPAYFDGEVASVVKLYVQTAHERDFGGDLQRKRFLEADYNQKLADLKFAWQQRTENQENMDAEELNVCSPTTADLADDAPLAASDETVLAFIADYANGDGTADVAALVKSWAPSYIVTGGNNWYGSLVTLDDLDAAVGEFYGDYIYPYMGTLADGAERTNAFFPVLGEHDRDPVGRLDLFQTYFNLRRPYYDFIQGHVHWFMVDNGLDQDDVLVQPDGNTSSSVQGDAFRLKMAVSTARWKVVVVAVPPYSSLSDGNTAYEALRWPYKAWGADLVLSGNSPQYERLLPPEGYPLIIGGWSGNALIASEPAIAYSLKQYDEDYGALKITVSCDELKVEAINRVGVVVDTLTLAKR